MIPTILCNKLIIYQGGSVVLNTNLLQVNTMTSSMNFLYRINNIQYGRFQNEGNQGLAITSFTYNELINDEIEFVHDGSTYPPSYSINVTNLATYETSSNIVVDVIFTINPKITNNYIKIKRGETLKITTSMLSAIDPDTNQASLLFYIFNVLNGQFEKYPDAGIAVNSFTQLDITNKNILFVHDSSYLAPQYEVSVSDGSYTTDRINGKVEFLIPMGIGGLKKSLEVTCGVLNSIALSKDNNYIIGAIWSGKISIFNIYDDNNQYLLKTVDLFDYDINNLQFVKVRNLYAYFTSSDQALVIVSIANISIQY